MLKTVLITGSVGMVVGFAGTLLTLFGGSTLASEYMEFAVLLVLFVVILTGSYWFVMINPRGMSKIDDQGKDDPVS